MTKFFTSIYSYFRNHKGMLFSSLLLLLVACALSISSLRYKEDIGAFLPDSEANERINRVYQQMGNSNKLMIFFTSSDSINHTERITEAIDLFTATLEERDSSRMIPEVISRIEEERMLEVMQFIQDNVPYFLTEADYLRIDTLLTRDHITRQLQANKQQLMLPMGSFMLQTIVADPLHLFTPLLAKLNDFRSGDQEELRDGYLFTNQGKKGMVVLTTPYGTSETEHNTQLLQLIEEVMQSVEQEQPEVTLSCFGAPAIAVTNANQIKRDSLLAISLSVLLISLLLIYYFRNARNILLIFLSVLFGYLFALAIMALISDQLSIIAVGISSIFIGIAINYPLHLIDHLKHQPNRRQALKEVISPLLIGNITTVSAFLSLLFMSSAAMRDLGLFGSLLLVGTILFVLLYLPHLVKPRAIHSESETTFSKLASFAPEKRRWIVVPVLLLTLLFGWQSQYTTFEADMHKINFMTAGQRQDMNDLMQTLAKRDKEIVYLVTEGAQMDEALQVYEQNQPLLESLTKEGWIESVSGIGNFLPSQQEQQQRLNRWHSFWEERKENLLTDIGEVSQELGFRHGSFNRFSQLLNETFQPQPVDHFDPIVKQMASNYLVDGEDRKMVVSLLYCDREKTTELMQKMQTAAPGSFSFDSRNIGERMIDALSHDFDLVLYVCGILVFLFLTLSFGRLELSVLSFLPLAVSWLWILGIMHLCGINFNIVNIILATFIFGQGDDYTIFITEGLMYEYTYRKKMLATYKNSIFLSALIMFVGIGTLIFAQHPAMRSLAEVTIVGMFSVVLMAYIIPPLLFRWLTQTKEGYRQVPLTFKRLFYSILVFTVFLIGSLLITLSGFFLFSFGRNNEKQKLRYHKLLRWVAEFVIRRVPGVRFRYENLSNEQFEKPAVIICNHQSHLDLMCLMMLTPKLVILTNDWVWNNPFYGRLIRFADFYPVSNGIEGGIDLLAQRIKMGYSVVIFPEGTRSENSRILRFHRGAFYLAQQLQLDILPVVIHGVGDVLPKKDFMLREGAITVQVHPRVTVDDSRFDSDYAIRTRQMRRYYREALASLAAREETTTYFKPYIRYNYMYKGLGVEQTVRRSLRRHNNYSQWIDSYTGEKPVLIVNNGEGIFGLLFSLVHKGVEVTAVDRDPELVELAKHCSGKPENLTICREEELLMDREYDTIFLLNPDEEQRHHYPSYQQQVIIIDE